MLRILLPVLSLCTLAGVAAPVRAEVDVKDVQVIARSLGFVNGLPGDSIAVAVLYDPARPATAADADRFVALLGQGAKAGSATLAPKKVAVGELGAQAAPVVLLPEGMAAHFETLRAAARGRGMVTVTTDRTCAEKGACVMAVRSTPKVEIVISRAAGTEAGVAFKQAFKMLITEI